MKVLVLGDCASAGTNCLDQQIIGEKHVDTEYSLLWNKENHKKLILWYLKMSKSQRGSIKDMRDIMNMAIDYLRDKELEISWVKHLDNKLDVTNISKGGATAYGYYKRLLKYEAKHKKPDIILLTDYDPTHPWQRININDQKYFLEKGYDPRRPDFKTNHKLKSPAEVQEIAFNKSKFYHHAGLNQKRNCKIMGWLCRYLEDNNYNFIKIKFYKGFPEFDIDPDVIDCSDLAKKYTVIPRGIISSVKLEVQTQIAKRIQDKLTNKLFRV